MEENERKNRLEATSKFFVVAVFLFFSLWIWQSNANAVINTQINYQAKLTNASGVTVSDGNYDIKIVIYTAASGGTCQYTLKGSCGTPTAASTTVTSGLFSINLGDTAAGFNALSSSLFNTSTLYLGVTVGSDSEMTPRKRITAAPYAFTALNLGGASSTLFVGTSTLPSNLVSYIENPATASAANKILVIRGNSSQSGHLMDLQNSSGASLAYITSGGSVRTSSTLLVTGDATFYATSSVRQLNTVRYADQFCSTPGTLDDTCVQNAINDCPANGCEVFVPAGTYNFSSGNVVLRNGVRVRGAGKGNTIINITAGHTGIPFSSTAFRATGTVDAATTIAGVYATNTTKTRQVQVASPSGFAAGNTIWIQGDPSTTSSAKEQMSTIEAISGNTFTLKDTLLFNFASNTVFQKITPVKNIGISDLTIQTSLAASRLGIYLSIIDTAAIERVKFSGLVYGILATASGVSNTTPNNNITIQDNDFDDLAGTADGTRAIYVFGNNFRILRNRIRGVIGKGMELNQMAYSLIANNNLLGDATTTNITNTFGIMINDSMVRSSIVNNTFTNFNFSLEGFNDVNNNPIAIQDSEISNNVFANDAGTEDPILMTSTVDFQRNVLANNVIKGPATNGIALFACTVKDNIITGNSIPNAANPINIGDDGAVCGASPLPPVTTKTNNYVVGNLIGFAVTSLSGPGNKVINNPLIGTNSLLSKIELATSSDTGFIFDSASSTPLTTSTILLSFRNAGTEKARFNAVGGLEVTNAAATSTFAGGLTVGTNKLVIYSTSSTVGVGTASPETLFNVNGVARMGQSSAFFNEILDTTTGLRGHWTGDSATNYRYQLTGDAVNFSISGSDSGALRLCGSGATCGTIYNPLGNNGLGFRVASTDALFINNSGHLVPASNNTYDLGGFGTGFFGAAWRDIYASGTLRVSGGSSQGGLQITASNTTTTLTSLVSGTGVGAFILDTARSFDSSTSTILLSVRNAGSRVFSVAADGGVRATGTFVSNASGIGDVAEYVDLTPGEVVEAGDVSVVDSTSLNKFKKSASANSDQVAGVISNSAKFIMGAEGAGRAALALAGLVKVKATAANGAIKVGDYLVTSDKPGLAMRYDSSSSTAASLIGQALEPLAEGDGQITILINRGLAPAKTVLYPAALHAQLSADGQLTVDKDLDFNGYAILNIKSISSKDNKWRLDEDGNLVTIIKTAHGDKELYTLQNVNAKEILLSGLGALSNGRAEIVFEPIDQEIIDNSVPLKVTVSLREPAQGLYVSESSGQGFTVKELNNGSSNASFSWLVIAKRRDSIVILSEVSAESRDPVASSTISLSETTSSTPEAASSTPVGEEAVTSTVASQ